MDGKYLPISVGQGRFALEEDIEKSMGKINSNISEWKSEKKHYNEINNLVVALLLWGYFLKVK